MLFPSSVDWVIVHMLADRQGSIGHVRYVMKDSLQLVPMYGFYFYEVCLFEKCKNYIIIYFFKTHI